jgi:hypothetical protein
MCILMLLRPHRRRDEQRRGEEDSLKTAENNHRFGQTLNQVVLRWMKRARGAA